MIKFKVGDSVYISESGWRGTIVEIDKNIAYVEFATSTGGGRLPFELSELEHV